MIRDPLGFQRLFHDRDGRAHAPTIRALFAARPELPRTLDREAVDAHLSGRFPPARTLFAAVAAVPPGHALEPTSHGWRTRPRPVTPRLGDWQELLAQAISATLATAPAGRAAVALSGGLDSALVLALARAVDPTIGAFVLAPALDGYGELDAALASARLLGVTPAARAARASSSLATGCRL